MATNAQYHILSAELDPEKLIDEAIAQTGLSDFGDETFKIALRKFMDCSAREVNFHATGVVEFKQEIVRHLVNRLRFQSDLKNHPEILDEDVSDPIIVIGLPRSGTTKTMRMMATDPSLFKTYMWQLMNPAPFPDAIPGQSDPRIKAAMNLDSVFEENEEIHAGQYFAANEVHEDLWLFALTFNNDLYVGGRTPSWCFANWVRTRSEPSDLHNYRYVHSLFQYLQWQQGGRGNKRWLMKHTDHLAQLPQLLQVYPKATIVHIHRHPKSCIASLAKLNHDVLKLRIANVDPMFVGKYNFARAKYAIDKYLVDRDRLNLNDRILDVQYEDIRVDPMPVIREMYRRADHPLTAAAEQAMSNWEQENEQGKRGRHVYSMEQFGLSKAMIDEAFGPYIDRFLKSKEA